LEAYSGESSGDRQLNRWAAAHAATIFEKTARRVADLPAARPAVLAEFVELSLRGSMIDLDGDRIACGIQADGNPFLATAGRGGIVRIWDAESGEKMHDLNGDTAGIISIAWSNSGQQSLLAAGALDGSVQIWDPETGDHLHTLTPPSVRRQQVTVSWESGHNARPLLATVGPDVSRTWDVNTGRILNVLQGTSGESSLATWARAPDGSSRLAISESSVVRIWDPDADWLMSTVTIAPSAAGGLIRDVAAIAYGLCADGQLLLAASDGHQVCVWKEADGTFTPRKLDIKLPSIDRLSWASLEDGRTLLAGSSPGMLHIWDGCTFELLYSSRFPHVSDICWIQARDGRLLLVASGSFVIREYEVVLSPPALPALKARAGRITSEDVTRDRPTPPGPEGTIPLADWEAAETSSRLLRLGAGGMWPPLGLIADILSLTNADWGELEKKTDHEQSAVSPLCDARLAALGGAVGVARLRDLAGGEPRWGSDARVAFVALLASELDIPDGYVAPANVSTGDLLDALTGALSDRTAAVDQADSSGDVSAKTLPGVRAVPPQWRVSVADLTEAATTVTDQIIALLTILGPDDCAADPLLPVRLAHRARRLPALSARELRMLATATAAPSANRTAPITGAMTLSPGTAGVARTGPLNLLLPTQIALPRDLLTVRLAGNQLLYRLRQAPTPPALAPVTIILDTTPPTFGPAGNALRVATHLIAITLWQHGRHAVLITLTDPETCVELRTSADLVRLWASSTLSDPDTTFATAQRTAARLGHPIICCTHFQTAQDIEFLSGSRSRLLTSHQPPEDPPIGRNGPWRVHLPPGPTQAQLAAAVSQLLAAVTA
jgi:hypothetical protein